MSSRRIFYRRMANDAPIDVRPRRLSLHAGDRAASAVEERRNGANG
ncbi:MAG: hypothetical protein ACI4PW_01310 [Alphaproteobacteria bacterium]